MRGNVAGRLRFSLDIDVVDLVLALERRVGFDDDSRILELIAHVDLCGFRGYHERLRAFLDRAEQFCRGNEITYHRVVTETPVEEFMLRQLKGLLLA